MPVSQIIKPDAKGNATRWQGYVALDGFGMTRIRNQTSAAKPESGNSHRSHLYLLPGSMTLPVLGQTLSDRLLHRNAIITPPPILPSASAVMPLLHDAAESPWNKE
jgi:hypothetical protein